MHPHSEQKGQTHTDLSIEAFLGDLIGTHKGRKRANDLDGATWLRYSIPVWSDIKKASKERSLGHPAIFPVQLVTRLIECFTTKEEKIVLDPFVGVGSTVVAADRMGKTGIGLDISPAFVYQARERLAEKGLRHAGDTGSAVYQADANDVLHPIRGKRLSI